MVTIEQLEADVKTLPFAEIKKFAQWIIQYQEELDSNQWDTQIEHDANTGKLDTLANRALEHYHAGRTTKI